MATTIQLAKKALRAHVQHVLTSTPSVVAKSHQLFLRVIASPVYVEARRICLFLSMPKHEVQTYELLQHALLHGKAVFVPKVFGKASADMTFLEITPEDIVPKTATDGSGIDASIIHGFEVSKWGIPEPPDRVAAGKEVGPLRVRVMESTEPVDVVFVPGMAFDVYGNRLGHGKGYYGAACLSMHF
jgi:5-formyltetrahydrofolate cyclo-ligase